MHSGIRARKLAIALFAGAATIGALGAGGMAVAQSKSENASTTYSATLDQLNNSGASGKVTIRLSANGKNMLVRIQASGLEAGGPHLAHIHAVDSGNSSCPTGADDSDGDGYVELLEAAGRYGPIRVDFMNIDPDQDGTVDFQTTVKLDGNENIMPLTNAHIVVHGLSVPADVGAGTPGEVNGTAGFKAVLPVLCGEIQATGTRANPMEFRTN